MLRAVVRREVDHHAAALHAVVLTDRLVAGFMPREGTRNAVLTARGHKVPARDDFRGGNTDVSAPFTQAIAVAPAALVLRDAPTKDVLITKKARRLGYRGAIVWEVNAPAATVARNIFDAEMNGVLNGLPPHTGDCICEGKPNALTLARMPVQTWQDGGLHVIIERFESLSGLGGADANRRRPAETAGGPAGNPGIAVSLRARRRPLRLGTGACGLSSRCIRRPWQLQ
ncbi:MAG: hypothetical protein M0Z28_09950, partial [Rhodospirillales bacterium]|nr:hypothetical protein [Rhodospirillales bacterium]